MYHVGSMYWPLEFYHLYSKIPEKGLGQGPLYDDKGIIQIS